MRRYMCATASLLAIAMVINGCRTASPNESKRQSLVDESTVTLNRFKNEDPSLNDMLGKAYGYAIFPSIGKGGLIVGGAYGRGVVYEQGAMVGYADVTQASIGAQIGGQT